MSGNRSVPILYAARDLPCQEKGRVVKETEHHTTANIKKKITKSP
jgi:hypothetical protein